ncbi:hypothetical protein [Burkholderia phage FLC9]|nr:hypothetical protein [Burkholderia phage FLC9]
MAKINASLSALDNLLAIVNAANTGQTITNTQVTAGTPSVKSDTGDGRNTTVVLTAQAGQGYTGTVSVNYTRRGLNDSVLSPVDSYTATTGDTADSILTALCTQLGLVKAEVHLEDPAAPGTPLSGAQSGNQASLNIVTKAGSLLYVDGSTQAIAMTWDAPQVALSTAVATTDLGGFDAAS